MESLWERNPISIEGIAIASVAGCHGSPGKVDQPFTALFIVGPSMKIWRSDVGSRTAIEEKSINVVVLAPL